ncbi:ABC transporter substrate-binding protein [Haladaptatus sp. NG-SE-30]
MSSQQDSNLSSVSEDLPKTGRRELLATLGMALGSGCIEEARSLVSRDQPKQISLSIKTLPADADPRAIRIARFLAQQLEAVGVSAQVVPMERVELQREILLNQSFDCYVASHPGFHDADELRTLLHSRFDTEAGWQNPFGYANLGVDKQLTAQRRQSGHQRRKTLRELQHSIARDQPFTVVAFPDEIRATRVDRFDGWTDHGSVHSPLGYFSLQSRGSNDRRLRMTLQDSRPTENLNPLSVEFRNDGSILGLLYDPLGRWIDGKVRPWLATSWEWQSEKKQKKPVVKMRLRDNLFWHDEAALTAEDVAFTYRYLGDTAIGTHESPIPAPRFRGASSLVESATAIDERMVRIQFGAASRAVAVQAFTIPILPKHIWRSKHKQAEIAGFGTDSTATKALVWNNMQPVGSGPLQFKSAKLRQSVTFERFDRHFLSRIDTDDDKLDPKNDPTPEPAYIERYAGGLGFEQLRFIIVPSGAAAAKLVLNDDADGTATSVTADEVRDIGRAENVQLHVDESPSMYHVGFNARKAPFSNVRFRRSVARLLDKEYLVESVFGGYADPATSPLARQESLAEDLRWSGNDSELPFPGENGNLNVSKAKAAFKKAGYRYTNDGKLLRR